MPHRTASPTRPLLFAAHIAALALTPVLTLAALPALAQADVLATALKEPGAVKTESGLIYRITQPGKGAKPTADDTVRVHYRGTLSNGKEFDSSYKRGQPAEFPLRRVIRCWTEGVQLMNVGAKARLTCPAELAYGDRNVGNGLIPPNSVLQFEVELLAIVGAAEAKGQPR